jgi:hypothetical protein
MLLGLPRSWPAGTRFAAFLVVYGAARAGLGIVELEPAFLFGLQIEQLLAIGAVGFGLIYGVRPLIGPRWRAVPGVSPGPVRANEDSLAA